MDVNMVEKIKYTRCRYCSSVFNIKNTKCPKCKGENSLSENLNEDLNTPIFNMND